MKIETVALEDQQTKLIAELDSATLERYKRQAARKISQNQKIPGFRPGKAPFDLVRRIVGDEALTQEAVELMLDEVYPQVLKEAGVNPSGPGKLEEIVKMDPPTFSFVVPLPPSVELGDYREIRKEYNPEPVTEEQVEATLRRLQRSYSTAEPVERPAEKGDLVSFTLSAKRTKVEEGQDETLVQETPYQMIAGEEDEDQNDTWPYKGFSDELIGLSAEETKTVTHTFDEESPYEDLRGTEAEFTIVVQNVKAMKLPELNDEFAQTLGDFENLEKLREAIRQQLEQTSSQQYDQEYFDGLINELVEKATVKYPPHMLEEEIEQFLHGLEHNLERDRLDLNTYLKMREMDRETFIEKEVKPAAERRLLRSLVLEEFARRENVEIKNEELQYIYYNAQQQVSEFQKSRTGKRQNPREMANALAVNTLNSIFNQRIMQRLKAIATGKGDEEEEQVEAAEPVEGEPAMESEATAETQVETAAKEEQPAAVEQTGEASPVIGDEAAEEEQSAAEADLPNAEPPQADLDPDNQIAGENEA